MWDQQNKKLLRWEITKIKFGFNGDEKCLW
jgi:hypothetical protein